MRYLEAYHRAVEIFNRDIGLLFQRLNFFLIATAFLIAAFATITTVGKGSTLLNFDYILSSAGMLYSFISASVNYLNTRLISQIGKFIRYLESKNFEEEVVEGDRPYNNINQIVEQSMHRRKVWCLIPHMFISMFTIMINPEETTQESSINHTYIIPSFFAIVWLALLVSLPFWS